MTHQIQANKLRLRNGLYSILLDSLAKIKTNKKVIPYPQIFSAICVRFSIPKKQAWDILFLLQEVGLITLVNGHGVRLEYSI